MANAVKISILATITLLIVVTEVKPNPPGMYIEVLNIRKPSRFKRYPDIFERWTHFSDHVTSIIDWFKPKSDESNQNSQNEHQTIKEEAAPLKEHGALARGRVLVYGIEQTISKFSNKVGLTTSATTGLDTDKDKGFFGNAADKVKNYVKAIYPGTVWCGDGDVARSDDDLGYFKKTDSCCREHDHCNDTIASGEIRDGLENTGSFTRSNCECDRKFHDCLKAAGTIIAQKIGFTYFSILGPQCFKMEYPILKCKQTGNWPSKRCNEYKIDSSRSQRLQWFDNPAF